LAKFAQPARNLPFEDKLFFTQDYSDSADDECKSICWVRKDDLPER
jgi:hypothetical protein